MISSFITKLNLKQLWSSVSLEKIDFSATENNQDLALVLARLHKLCEKAGKNTCVNCGKGSKPEVFVEKLAWNPTFVMVLIFIIFAIGLFGFLFNRSHILLTIISGELMLLAAYLSFAHGGYTQADPRGSIYALLILVIAASESAIGLALIIRIHRLRRTATLSSLRFLRG